MLYRFREAQAAELGLGTPSTHGKRVRACVNSNDSEEKYFARNQQGNAEDTIRKYTICTSLVLSLSRSCVMAAFAQLV
jgi:hypothetical protein